MVDRVTTLHCTQAIRDLWPSPLAEQWHMQYPSLFDDDDLRLTVKQPAAHFSEWFTAIHLFHRDGAYSLVEKYIYKAHPRKVASYEQALTTEVRGILDAIRLEFSVQLPDLLVLTPNGEFSFGEVKGPGDRLSSKQRASHQAIEERLQVPVETFNVRIANPVVPSF